MGEAKLRTGRCSAAARGTKGVAPHLYSPGTSSHSSSTLSMSFKMLLSHKMPLSVPSMPYFGLDLSSLNFKGFLWLYRDSLRQPCRELAESVHLNSFSLVFFLASWSGMCLKWDKGGKRAGRVARETFPLTGWMVFIPPSHSRKRVNMGGSESHPSAGPCISYISHLFLTRHKAADVRSSRNSQCYPR